jgi:hypothetical protein
VTGAEENLNELEGKLFEIPEAKFVQLVTFLEKNLERGGDTTPLRLLLSKMRPRMVQVRPPRRNTVKRQLCRPFEELLYNTKSLVPVDGRIPRNAIEPIYRVYEEETDKDQIAAMEQELAGLPVDDPRCEPIASKVWAYGAVNLRSLMVRSQRDTVSKRDLIDKLRGEHIFKALGDVVDILEIADIVQSMRKQLPPRPIQTLSTGVVKIIGEHMDKAIKFAPKKAETLLLVAMGCLEKPWEIMEALEKLALEQKKTIDPALSALAVRALVTGAEQRLETMRLDLEGGDYKPDSETLARQIADLAKTMIGAKSAVQSSGQGKGLDRQLDRARRSLRDMVQVNILGDADKSILANLMATGADAFATGGDSIHAWDNPPDEAKLREAEQRAIALRLCARYAEELGLGGEAEEKLGVLKNQLTNLADNMIESMQGRFLTTKQRGSAEANLYASVRLIELLAGPDVANDLRLRGVSALEG